jgi:deoxyribose-phosphate aldolase
MNQDSSLEHLMRVVSEEVHRSLTHDDHALANGSCPWCAQSCGGHCSAEVNRMVEVGANRVSALAPDASIDRSIASLIDHTLLKADATYEEIRKICEEAKRYGFASVCINPSMVSLASRILVNSAVRVCTVVGFPLGATLGEAKAFEAEASIVNGAHEIDMVLNIGALKSKDLVTVGQDIHLVVQVCRARGPVRTAVLAVLAQHLREESGRQFIVLLVRPVWQQRDGCAVHRLDETLRGHGRPLAVDGADVGQARLAQAPDSGAHDAIRHEPLLDPAQRCARHATR